VPTGTGTPLVAMLSLTVTGTPSTGPSGAPSAQRRADAAAAARAPAGSSAHSAFSFGSHASIRCSTASVTSTGDRLRSR